MMAAADLGTPSEATVTVALCGTGEHICTASFAGLQGQLELGLCACRGTEQEVEDVVAKARMFQFKPDGEVTMRFAQDGNGMPAPVMQVGGPYSCGQPVPNMAGITACCSAFH